MLQNITTICSVKIKSCKGSQNKQTYKQCATKLRNKKKKKIEKNVVQVQVKKNLKNSIQLYHEQYFKNS